MKDELYLIADEMRATANAGLRWSENGYDKERYEHILKASARMVAALENSSEEDVLAQYTGNLAHLSPLVGVETAVFRDSKILLIKRRDSSLWAMPGGLLEVGESPAEGAERELWEETGVRGKAARLLGLLDMRFWPGRSRVQLIIALFLVEAGGDPNLHAGSEGEISSMAETLDLGFFAEDDLPEMHPGHDLRVPKAFELARAESGEAYFDG